MNARFLALPPLNYVCEAVVSYKTPSKTLQGKLLVERKMKKKEGKF